MDFLPPHKHTRTELKRLPSFCLTANIAKDICIVIYLLLKAGKVMDKLRVAACLIQSVSLCPFVFLMLWQLFSIDD